MPETPHPDHLAAVPYALHEIEAIAAVLNGSLLALKRLPVTPEREKSKQYLEQIIPRLEAQIASGTVTFFLAPDELEVVLTAMLDYVALVERLFPRNHQRDTAVHTVTDLRMRLIHHLSQRQAE